MAHTVCFAEEDMSEIVDEVHALAEENHKETSPCSGALGLDVKRATYCSLAKMRMLATFTVRDEGKLVGYSPWIVQQNLHYDGLWATSLTFWIDPAYRQGMTAMRFQKFIEGLLIARGVTRLMSETPVGHPAMGAILQRRGFQPSTQTFIKVV